MYNTIVFLKRTFIGGFLMNTSYIIIDNDIAPDVFKKVIEVKRMMASGKYKSVNEALDTAKLSRTAFYKYKNHVFSSEDTVTNNIATLAFTLEDVTGVLSQILGCLAQRGISILTINQNIPISDIANMTISLRISDSAESIDTIIGELKKIHGVNKVHLLAMN